MISSCVEASPLCGPPLCTAAKIFRFAFVMYFLASVLSAIAAILSSQKLDFSPLASGVPQTNLCSCQYYIK